jgi:hypothetical protein
MYPALARFLLFGGITVSVLSLKFSVLSKGKARKREKREGFLLFFY